MKTRFTTLVLSLLLAASAMAADTTYQPFVLASVSDGDLKTGVSSARNALVAAGFEIAGQYQPLDNLRVLTGGARYRASAYAAAIPGLDAAR